MKYVYAKLSRAGFCNLLYPWARAEVFAHRHNLQVLNPRWVRFLRLGVWFRREYHKRYYGGMMTSVGCISGIRRMVALLFGRKTVCDNAMFSEENPDFKCDVVIFEGMVGKMEPFLEYQEYVRDRFIQMVNPKLMDESKVDGLYVGVHIRRGDFCLTDKLKTSDEWFVKATRVALAQPEAMNVRTIRIFSDGYPEQLSFLVKAFPEFNVVISPKAPAVCDLLALSKSTVLVASPQSTFSAWAVFLGQMPSVWSGKHSVDKMYKRESKVILLRD